MASKHEVMILAPEVIRRERSWIGHNVQLKTAAVVADPSSKGTLLSRAGAVDYVSLLEGPDQESVENRLGSMDLHLSTDTRERVVRRHGLAASGVISQASHRDVIATEPQVGSEDFSVQIGHLPLS